MSRKILIVSNNSIEARKFSYMLTDMRYDVAEVKNIKNKVISKLSEELPDLIVLDIEFQNKRRLVILTGKINQACEVPYLIACDALVDKDNVIEALRPVVCIKKSISIERFETILKTFFTENTKEKKEVKVFTLVNTSQTDYNIARSISY